MRKKNENKVIIMIRRRKWKVKNKINSNLKNLRFTHFLSNHIIYSDAYYCLSFTTCRFSIRFYKLLSLINHFLFFILISVLIVNSYLS